MNREVVKKYDISKMSIDNIKSKIEELNNTLDLYMKKREQAYNLTQPQAKQLKEVSVSGGERSNLFDKYVMTIEEIDPVIEYIKNEIKLLEAFLDSELKRIDKYDEWEKKVIYLREKGNKWLYIACNTPYSISTCKRIYRKYKTEKKD